VYITFAFVLLATRLNTVSICVSAIDPDELVPCVDAGADMVELGNFDMFYDQVCIHIIAYEAVLD
jgi:Protein of unknown function (DUF561)